MKKGLFLLAFLAFTQNVNADYAPIDIQIAEGEEYQMDQIIASQVINQTGWDGQYILTGGVARVYIDFLPREEYPGENGKTFYPFYVEQLENGGWWLYDSARTQKYSYPFDSPWDAYQWLISNEGRQFCGYLLYIYDDEDGNGEYLSLGQFQIGGNYNTSSTTPSLDAYKRNLDELALAQNRARFLTASDILEYAQVPINGVRITVTNAYGQTTTQFDTNVVLKLDQILQKVTRIQSDTSTMVQELALLINAFGFDGQPGSSTSNLAEFLGQWRTADGLWQGDVLNVITNSVDYTDYLKLLVDTSGNPTNLAPFVWLHNTFTKQLGSLGTFGTYKGLLNNSQANFLYGSDYRSAFNLLLRDMVNNYLQDNSSVSALGLLYDFQNLYLNMGSQYQEAVRQTNIVNAVSLGRDWLTLATNDISSLPYWLNQQDFSSAPPIGVTNWQAQTRWSVLTNQYAQIGLTGSGQQANSAETWNYFKRLEMLLAALVYKPDDEGEKLSNDMNSQSSDAETKKQDVKNSLDGLLSSFGGQKTLLQDQTSSFLSALGRVNELFDQTWTPGQWRYWKDGAEDGGSSSSGGASGSSVELWIDFSDSKYQFIFDYIRSLCGFLWSFFSLLVIYRFAILVHKLGMKVAKVAFSIFRHMFGS